MRVLHVICDLAGGGAERLVLELCRHAGPGVQPIVAPVHDGGVLAPAFAAAGVDVRSAGRVRGRPGLRATARLARLAAEVDVVHTHLWAGDTWGRVAASLARAPVVVTTEHNTGGEGPVRVAVSRLLARVSDAVVCVSDAAAARARAQGIPRVQIIENGIDLSCITPRGPHAGRSRRVLAIGRLTRQKGFDVLRDALDLCPGVTADVVGEGEDAALLARPSMALHGWVADVRPLLSRADTLVVPSRWEGFGLVAVEAMAAGVPVIASGVDGLAEVVGDAGVLVPPEDPRALAAAIRALAADPARRDALAAAGLVRARRFDIRRTAAAYEALYASLLGRAPGRGGSAALP